MICYTWKDKFLGVNPNLIRSYNIMQLYNMIESMHQPLDIIHDFSGTKSINIGFSMKALRSLII